MSNSRGQFGVMSAAWRRLYLYWRLNTNFTHGLLFGLGIIFFLALVSICWCIWKTSHPLPWHDEWDTFHLLSLYVEGKRSLLAALFSLHNEHRIAFPRLIYYLDIRVSGAGNINRFATMFFQFGTACWLLMLIIKKDASAKAVLFLCVLCLLFSGQQMSNFIWGFQVQVTSVYFFALSTFGCLASLCIKNQKNYFLSVLGLFLFSFLSIFSMGNGIIVPFIAIIIMAGLKTIPLRVKLIYIIFAAGIIIFYFYEFPRSQIIVGFGSAWLILKFGMHFLGGPFTSVLQGFVPLAGGLVLVMSIFLILLNLKAKPSWCLVMIAASVSFILVSAALVSVSRFQTGLEGAVESRYATPNLILYSFLLISFWPRDLSNFGNKLIIISTSVLVGIFCIISHARLPYDYSGYARLKAAAETAFLSGVKDDEAFLSIISNPSLAWGLRPFIFHNALSIYSTTISRSIGLSIKDFDIRKERCIGYVDKINQIKADTGLAVRVTGWIYDRSIKQPLSSILYVDQTGIIRGGAQVTIDRSDVRASDLQVKHNRIGFTLTIPQEVFEGGSIFGILTDSKSLCAITMANANEKKSEYD